MAGTISFSLCRVFLTVSGLAGSMNIRRKTCDIRLTPKVGLFFLIPMILAATTAGNFPDAFRRAAFCSPASPYLRYFTIHQPIVPCDIPSSFETSSLGIPSSKYNFTALSLVSKRYRLVYLAPFFRKYPPGGRPLGDEDPFLLPASLLLLLPIGNTPSLCSFLAQGKVSPYFVTQLVSLTGGQHTIQTGAALRLNYVGGNITTDVVFPIISGTVMNGIFANLPDGEIVPNDSPVNPGLMFSVHYTATNVFLRAEQGGTTYTFQ